MTIKREIRVNWLRFLKKSSYLLDKFYSHQEHTDLQIQGLKIFTSSLKTPGSEIFWHFQSEIIYIEVNEIFVVLDGNNLEIINGKFHHSLIFRDKVIQSLRKKVLLELDKKRGKILQRIRLKNSSTLSNCLNDINKIKEKS